MRRALRRHARLLITASLVMIATVLGTLHLQSVQDERFAEARRFLREARLGLLDPRFRIALWESSSGNEHADPPSLRSLRRASRRYEEVLATAPLKQARVEWAWLQLAESVLTGRPPSAASLQVLEEHCPQTLAWAGGPREGVPALEDWSEEDRQALGLVAFLTGRLEICPIAWEDQAKTPLIAACLGQALLESGRAPWALSYLTRALEAFPEAGFLATDAAEAAILSGELALARTWFESAAEAVGTYAPLEVIQDRVEGDLLLADGGGREALAEARGNPGGPALR